MNRDRYPAASRFEPLAEELLRQYFRQALPQQLPPIAWLELRTAEYTPTQLPASVDPTATRSGGCKPAVAPQTEPRSGIGTSAVSPHLTCVPFQNARRENEAPAASRARTAHQSVIAASLDSRWLLLAAILFLGALLFVTPWRQRNTVRFPADLRDGQARDKPALVPAKDHLPSNPASPFSSPTVAPFSPGSGSRR